jgi:hypothetical protein
MIRTRNQEKFEGYQKDLWGYLKKILKSSNPRECADLNNFILKTKKSMSSVELMEKTLRNISPYIDQISRKDEFIFTPEFGNAKSKPLQFIPSFDFRRVWAKRDLTKENKRIIFRYLELIYINSSLALNKNREKVNELVEAIKMEQEINDEAKANPNAFGDADQGASTGGAMDFNSIFGDDNIIMELVQDLKSEFNLEEMLGELMGGRSDGGGSGGGGGLGGLGLQPGQNPMQLLQTMSSNPQMQEMMKNISTRLESKIKEKGITQDDIVKSTESIKTNLMNHVSKMPGGSHFKKLINNLDLDKMMSQMQLNGGVNALGGMGGAGGGGEGGGMAGVDPAQMMAHFQNIMQQSGVGIGGGEGNVGGGEGNVGGGEGSVGGGEGVKMPKELEEMFKSLTTPNRGVSGKSSICQNHETDDASGTSVLAEETFEDSEELSVD